VLELVLSKTFFSYELASKLGVLLFIDKFRERAWSVWGLADWIFCLWLPSLDFSTLRCAFFISTGLSANLVSRSVTLASVAPFLPPD
jgi:hypothetical protein